MPSEPLGLLPVWAAPLAWSLAVVAGAWLAGLFMTRTVCRRLSACTVIAEKAA